MLETILDFSEEDVCKEGGFLEKQFDMDIPLPVKDLELLADDFFSFNEIELLLSHSKQKDFKFARSLPKKPRSKRVGGRTWSLSLPLPLDGGSVSSTTKRRCGHCQAYNTPQWRIGPMGPKTLCNACGLRYRSGQLVPEYRPASSPTFVGNLHSNSHRKIMGMRQERRKLCR